MTPRIYIRTQDKDHMTFHLSSASPRIANTLRRAMMNDIPTMAMDHVIIEENTSMIHDEWLARKMGLIPLVSSGINSVHDPCPFSEKGCDACTVTFQLHVKCDTPWCWVTSHDVTPVSDSTVVPVRYESDEHGIPIAVLSQGQEIKLTAMARKGTGQDHAKWRPVTVLYYRFESEWKVDHEQWSQLNGEQQQRIVDSCPLTCYTMNQHQMLDMEDTFQCTFCQECIRTSTEMGHSKMIEITPKEDSFLFYVETVGQLSAREILNLALAQIEPEMGSIQIVD